MLGESAPRSGGRRRPAPRGPKPRIFSRLPPPLLPRAAQSRAPAPPRGERLAAPLSPRGLPSRRAAPAASGRAAPRGRVKFAADPALPPLRWGSMKDELWSIGQLWAGLRGAREVPRPVPLPPRNVQDCGLLNAPGEDQSCFPVFRAEADAGQADKSSQVEKKPPVKRGSGGLGGEG